MELLDIASLEEWVELESTIHTQTNMNVAVFNAKGERITTNVNWGNSLCPTIKGNPDGAKFICACANQVISNKAFQEKETVVEECDAGFTKVCVPVLVDGTPIGSVSGCGLLMEGTTLDMFYVHKTTGMELDELQAKADSVSPSTNEQVERMLSISTKWLQERIT